MGAGSLVLGIISLVMGLIIPGSAIKWVGAVVGLIGIILGVQGRKDPEKRGLATGGMVCSIIGFIFCIITVLFSATVVGGLGCLGSMAN